MVICLPDWSDASLRPIELGGGHGIPLEVKPPVEATPDNGGGGVGECVGRDDVNDGADNGVAILLDGSQQRLQPRLVHLTVTVQEDQHLTWTHNTGDFTSSLPKTWLPVLSWYRGPTDPICSCDSQSTC